MGNSLPFWRFYCSHNVAKLVTMNCVVLPLDYFNFSSLPLSKILLLSLCSKTRYYIIALDLKTLFYLSFIKFNIRNWANLSLFERFYCYYKEAKRGTFSEKNWCRSSRLKRLIKVVPKLCQGRLELVRFRVEGRIIIKN